MIVVIEGPDGVGKTTLINNLVKEYPLLYKKFPLSFPTYKKDIHASKTPQHLRDKLYDYLLNEERGNISDLQFQYINLIDKVIHHNDFIKYKEDRETVYLIDRYKASGYVYGVSSMLESNLFNGNEEFIRYVNEQMISLVEDPTFDVLLYADHICLLDRIDDRNEKKSVYEKEHLMKCVCREYIRYFNTFITKGVIVDALNSSEEVAIIVHNLISQNCLSV